MAERRFDLAASLLRADSSDARALAEVLAVKLSVALPDQTKTRRRGGRLLSRAKSLESVEVQLGEDTFVLSLSGGKAQTSRAKTVRGVVIKRQELPLDAWLEALGVALSAEAQRSEAVRLSLERLLG
jgi:ABC-type nitrate/sulfonate/bicarbonate transport system ATPase subunit